MRPGIEYIIYLVIILYLGALVGAKIYSPFWFHQPVYHVYELYPRWWARAPYIKTHRPPRFGIFCNLPHIRTTTAFESPDIHLLQGHYIDNAHHLCHYNMEILSSLLCPYAVVVSRYHERIHVAPNYRLSLQMDVAYGCIVSRPVTLYFAKWPSFPSVHYWDFVCVHEKYREKNLSRQLIQTHIYNHRRLDPNFSGAYIFKKEVSVCKGIVPLISTQAYTFLLKSTPIHKLPLNYSIRHFNKTHVDLWRAIYAEMSTTFALCVLPDLATSLSWLSNGRYCIYATVYTVEKREYLHGIYILEDTYVSWDDESVVRSRMVRLAASMVFGQFHRHDSQHLLFFRGFVHVLRDFIMDKKEFGILEIPNCSHNGWILERWREKYALHNETSLAYYGYNFVFPGTPMHPSSFLCLA